MALNGSVHSHSTTRCISPLAVSGDKTKDIGCRMSVVSSSVLRREDSRESTPGLSQASEYFEHFGNGEKFWAEAAEAMQGNGATQVNTPPTSPSSAGSSGIIPRSSSKSGPFVPESIVATSDSDLTSHPAALTRILKRTASQASIGPGDISKNTKKPKSSLSDQSQVQDAGGASIDRSFINLSPPHSLQRFIDSRDLPYSAQWELARLVSKGLRSWEGKDAITIDELNQIRSADKTKTSHSEGARNFLRVFYHEKTDDPFAPWNDDERKATDPWPELEREEAFAEAHSDPDQIDERGGRIHFLAALKKATNTSRMLTIADYKIELSQAQLGTSNSFSRRFGSKHFLRLKIPPAISNKSGAGLIDYLRKPIILCQSVFRAFYAKEQTVFYFKTNEVWNPKLQVISPPTPSAPGIGLLEFIEWHNSIELNKGQTMAKWAARFSLGLSSSIHGITLHENDITIIDDIKSDQGSDMTDGAGYITRRLLQRLTLLHDWPSRPSAIQVRVRGSKGLLVENPDCTDETLGVQLRPSLVKIRYPEPLDATHTTIDILRTSHARSPIRISADVIINLHENGVQTSVLKELMKKSLEGIIQPLLNWDNDPRNAMLELWTNFERAGSVIKARRAREDKSLARVKGFTELDTTEEVEEDDEEANELEEAPERSTDWWPDRVSGCPSSLEETIMEFLDSGFHPATCAMLREKAFKVVQSTIKRVIANRTIDIPLSAGAWIVPDPSGLLEPNQVFFQSSQRLIALDGTETGIITGDVLITRDPCRLPTDVQKWKAVDIPALYYLKDVIVLSIRGPRRAADWLAGGDYDGDKAKLIWQPELVQDFNNADPSFADPPPDLDSYFSVENKRVVDFLAETKGLTEEQKVYEMQKYLLGTIQDLKMVGMYSNFHEYSTYVTGYASSQTKLLAYMFTTVLDGRKTGKTVRQEIFKEHRRRFADRQLKWKEPERKKGEGELAAGYNLPHVKQNPKFIMEELVSFGRELKDEMLQKIEKKLQSYPNEADSTLIQPYMELLQKVQGLRSRNKPGDVIIADAFEADLEIIRGHVEEIYRQHKDELKRQATAAAAVATSGAGFTGLTIGKRQDILRKLSKKFHSKPEKSQLRVLYSENEIARIKASYAYYYDSKNPSPTRFPWNVAFRVLCVIKCGGEVKPIHRHFYDHMVIRLPKPHRHSPS